jgi:hypothetical protein
MHYNIVKSIGKKARKLNFRICSININKTVHDARDVHQKSERNNFNSCSENRPRLDRQCCFVWVWNLVPRPMKVTNRDYSRIGLKENIWISDRECRKSHNLKLFNLFLIRLLRTRPSGHREASAYKGKHRKKEGYTSMLRVVFEPVIPSLWQWKSDCMYRRRCGTLHSSPRFTRGIRWRGMKWATRCT